MYGTLDIYNFPRYAVLPGHEHKGCMFLLAPLLSSLIALGIVIPYDNVFGKPTPDHPHKRIHGTIVSLHPHYLTYLPHSITPPTSTPPEICTLYFDYAIYALGSHLPSPINIWDGTDQPRSNGLQQASMTETISIESKKYRYMGMKYEGITWLREQQKRVQAARNVLVVGGGALGIRESLFVNISYVHRRSLIIVHVLHFANPG